MSVMPWYLTKSTNTLVRQTVLQSVMVFVCKRFQRVKYFNKRQFELPHCVVFLSFCVRVMLLLNWMLVTILR